MDLLKNEIVNFHGNNLAQSSSLGLHTRCQCLCLCLSASPSSACSVDAFDDSGRVFFCLFVFFEGIGVTTQSYMR